jgi:hypothetical protein
MAAFVVASCDDPKVHEPIDGPLQEAHFVVTRREAETIDERLRRLLSHGPDSQDWSAAEPLQALQESHALAGEALHGKREIYPTAICCLA